VKVKVKDCLDNEAMRFTYQDVPIPWLKSRPTPKVALQKLKSKARSLLQTEKTPPSPQVSFPVKLDKPVTTTVSRPKVSRSSSQKEDEEEVLVVEGTNIIYYIL
jgi:polyphenol oxidase